MDTTQNPSLDFDSGTVAVQLENRVFPQQAPINAVTPLREDNKNGTTADIRRELTETLMGRLPIDVLATSATEGKEPLIAGYINCLSQIERCRAEFEQLVRAVCLASLEVHSRAAQSSPNWQRAEDVQDANQRVEFAKLDELVGRAGALLMPSRNIVTADLITRPIEFLRNSFDRALRQAVVEFTAQVFETLEHMVDEQIAGLIEWFDGNICRYHFFKAVLEHDANNTSLNPQDVKAGSGLRRRRSTRPIHHQHRLARHEHHAINAFCTSIDNSRVVIPDNVQQMIAAIPEWLRPFVRVVDGTLVRERIVERHLHTETTDIPVFGWEPAVIIGHFVLSGWGPREIERQRQQDAESAAKAAESLREQEADRWDGLLWLTLVAVITTGSLAYWMHPLFSILSVTLVFFFGWCGLHANDIPPRSPASIT